MNRNLWTSSLLAGALVLCSVTARSQDPPPAFEHGDGPGQPGPGGPFGERMELLGFEGLHPGKVVKGAPFSATASSESTQTLQDGTSIHRTTSSTLYRDSQGRFRREVTLSGFGPLEASGKPRTMITIGDPVAGVHYMLDPQKKVAHKMSPHGGKGGASSDARAQAFEQKIVGAFKIDHLDVFCVCLNPKLFAVAALQCRATQNDTSPLGQPSLHRLADGL